jgi:Ca-activated chloride channel homolog
MMSILKKIWCARIYWLILGSGILVQALAIRAEDAQSFLDSQTVIRVSSNLVAVPVSVTDAAGQAVSNLGIDDFRIQEDGRVETISKIADAGESPIQMALLFDLSGSLNSRFKFEQQAATQFLEKVWKPGDLVTIITFNEQPQISIRNCRSLPEALNALTNFRPTESSTAFYDSVIMASDILHQSAVPETRRSVIVLSDGEDNRSDRNAADAFHEFQQTDAIFYSINPSGPSIRLNEISKKGQEDMASIAAETGGMAFVSDMGGNLEQVFTRIANELRAQYLLSYYSSNSDSDNRFRRIAVSIPKRPDLRVQARQGYFAILKQAAGIR